MSQILDSIEARWEALLTAAKDAQAVKISTYNLYTGMTSYGTMVSSGKTLSSRLFMNLVAPKARFLVGIPPFIECVENCEHCQEQRKRSMAKFAFHKETWPSIDFRFAKEHHLKLYLFKIDGKWTGFTGGVNLSNSQWDDLLIRLSPEDAEKCNVLFESLWAPATNPLETFSSWK
jgi:hypothetical protein